jgi:hypothetical protein
MVIFHCVFTDILHKQPRAQVESFSINRKGGALSNSLKRAYTGQLPDEYKVIEPGDFKFLCVRCRWKWAANCASHITVR